MKDKKFEDYENINLPHEDNTNEIVDFSTEEEVSDLKEILIFEEK